MRVRIIFEGCFASACSVDLCVLLPLAFLHKPKNDNRRILLAPIKKIQNAVLYCAVMGTQFINPAVQDASRREDELMTGLL